MAANDNRFTVTVSNDLLAIEKAVRDRERYRSHSECYTSFLRHWAVSQQEHALTGGIAGLSPKEREAVDKGLRRLLENREGEDGKWLLGRVAEVIAELTAPTPHQPTMAPTIPGGSKSNPGTHRFTICLSDNLAAIQREIIHRERYRSHSECYASFLRHWALVQQRHVTTGNMASLPATERDALDAELREQVETGRGKKGSWLKARIYEAIKAKLGPDAKSPTIEQVMIRLPQVIRRELTALAK